MTKRILNRSSHTGKSPDEIEAYQKFLKGKRGLEKTVEDPQKLYKTDSSSFEEEESRVPEIQKSSRWLRIKDWFFNNFVISLLTAILSTLVITALIWAWNMSVNIKVQNNNINTINSNVEEIKNDIDEMNEDRGNDQDSFISLKQTFEVFKAEINKDIEFFKEKLKL